MLVRDMISPEHDLQTAFSLFWLTKKGGDSMKSLGLAPNPSGIYSEAYCQKDIDAQNSNIVLITAMIGMYVESGCSIEEAADMI